MAEGILRVCFEKKGNIKYVSHLDMTRLFSRAMTRAGINMRFSEGFNPHPRFTFALPLSVGMESLCELADFYLQADKDGKYITAKEAEEALRPQLEPCGIELCWCDVSSARKELVPYSKIKAAEYTVTLSHKLNEDSVDIISKVEKTDSIVVEKRTKNGIKETDIKPMIYSVRTEGRGVIKLAISAAPDRYLNPEYVISYISGLSDDIKTAADGCSIVRTGVIFG
ncbi:MAG: DUF2344 domain-containing protein [Ruminococcaceae bacterium]|nr:DUF2344 domain-containing protein [Oscillospiraceae bacterium]